MTIKLSFWKSAVINFLISVASDMNNDLLEQNELIKNIDNKMDVVNTKLNNQNYTMKRIR